MKAAWILATAMMTLGVSAQSAKVIQLLPEDAAKAAQLKSAQDTLDVQTKAFRAHITRDYLVTIDQKRGGALWSDPDDAVGFSLTGITAPASYFISGGSVAYHCETPAEKAQRAAEEKKEAEEREAQEKAHPTKYLKNGWDNPGYFQYTDDFKFIVPAESVRTYTTTPAFLATTN